MKRSFSLITIVARRIFGFAALAIVLQTAVVFADYWFDEGELGRLLVEHETTWIAESYRASRRDGNPFPDAKLSKRYGIVAAGPVSHDDEAYKEINQEKVAPGYFLRIRPVGGDVAYSNCGHECTEHFLPLDLDPPSFWDRMIEPVKPLTVAGGRTFPGEPASPPLLVDFASVQDPAGLVGGVFAREMTDHMLVPMGLMLFLVIGATILSIRQALRPVAAAARAADDLDPRGMIGELPTLAMPSEIAHLTRAVNRALGRVGELVRSQKLFAASIAHEIRTPVAIVKLELGRIDHPRARRAEGDLETLTHTLEQLTALARLDAVEGEPFSRQDLARLARDTVEDMAPLVFASGRSIGFRSSPGIEVDVVPALVGTLVRNLVGNAVKHTRSGTTITVAVEAPAILSVSDDGSGFPVGDGGTDTEIGAVSRSGSLGLGLKIVERITELHGARMVVHSKKGVGARVQIEFRARVPYRSQTPSWCRGRSSTVPAVPWNLSYTPKALGGATWPLRRTRPRAKTIRNTTVASALLTPRRYAARQLVRLGVVGQHNLLFQHRVALSRSDEPGAGRPALGDSRNNRLGQPRTHRAARRRCPEPQVHSARRSPEAKGIW